MSSFLPLSQRRRLGRLLGRQPAFYGLSQEERREAKGRGREGGREGRGKEGQLCKKSQARDGQAAVARCLARARWVGGSAPYCVANAHSSLSPSSLSPFFAHSHRFGPLRSRLRVFMFTACVRLGKFKNHQLPCSDGKPLYGIHENICETWLRLNGLMVSIIIGIKF